MSQERTTDEYDAVQHGIDDNPHDDAKKGAALGGLGGAAVGAAAGSMTGPVGAVIGAVVGGVAGAVASGAAVAAVDEYDDDDTVSGIGHVDEDEDEVTDGEPLYTDRGTVTDTYGTVRPTTTTGAVTPGTYGGSSTYRTTASGMTGTTSETYHDTLLDRDMDSASDVMPGNDVPGIQTGGRAIDGTPDTRGMSEKVADAVTGDHIDDKTGKYVP